MRLQPWERIPDPIRQAFFDDWCEAGLIQYNILFFEYAELREKGEWNAYARKHLGGRFQVKGEEQHV